MRAIPFQGSSSTSHFLLFPFHFKQPAPLSTRFALLLYLQLPLSSPPPSPFFPPPLRCLPFPPVVLVITPLSPPTPPETTTPGLDHAIRGSPVPYRRPPRKASPPAPTALDWLGLVVWPPPAPNCATSSFAVYSSGHGFLFLCLIYQIRLPLGAAPH
ncbi:hypothetical protein BO71DRAFT_133798 [Aspergillus ellipticus CBS 707.79]|uniref:Uncharacterized protein n=1 Tax=Aspergillus ellipticus CBS 707.79 TaxID=1448320 RepID=A0A319DIK9_9EURO|nr:hypothetical protein BO71DRAFT_133798 [Aspergillus ellipticus CBS 707.79]